MIDNNTTSNSILDTILAFKPHIKLLSEMTGIILFLFSTLYFLYKKYRVHGKNAILHLIKTIFTIKSKIRLYLIIKRTNVFAY